MSEKNIIGWREHLSIPELNIKEVKVKVDTGARTSAIHVEELDVIEENGVKYAVFKVFTDETAEAAEHDCKIKIAEMREVRSSNGMVDERPVINTDIMIGVLKKKIELTLVSRELMGFKMLLGRTALRDDFIVDPGKSFMQSNNLKESES